MPTLPTIHPNGTPAFSLVDGLAAASEALDAAYRAVKATAPNPRDYYPQPGTMDLALTEHMDRLRRVDVVKDEIDGMIHAIELLAT